MKFTNKKTMKKTYSNLIGLTTSSGYKVKFYVLLEDQKEIHGACKIGDYWVMKVWNSETGQDIGGTSENLCHKKQTGYINIYMDCIGIASCDKEVFRSSIEADEKAKENRVASVKVEY